MKVSSVAAYCQACYYANYIYAGDPYVNHMGIRGYAMKCNHCGTRWTEPIAELPVGTEASIDDGPITQPCHAPNVDRFCPLCGQEGTKSCYDDSMLCLKCGFRITDANPPKLPWKVVA